MSDIEVGQVIALIVRFNNQGSVASRPHPYLVVDVDHDLDVIELAQIDSLQGKEYKALFRSNKTIFCDNPTETVIDKDSYVQLDNTIRIDNFRGLAQFRRQSDKLSSDKLKDVLEAYRRYHEDHMIDENKNVYMDMYEVLSLNTRN